MLEIKNLHVEVKNQKILHGIDLCIKPGEVHAIMGPNGSGKSTLTNILAGKDGYTITNGTITYLGEDLLEMSIEERAHLGIFVAFQYPIALPGVSNVNFMKAAVNANRKARDQKMLDAMDFLKLVKEKLNIIKMDEEFLYRSVNDGFSGGEKKRNEVLQMALLEPTLCILDETDSGLDIDALKVVANAVNTLRDKKRSFLVITHYQRLLNHIIPDHVHVLQDGVIVRTGDQSLAFELDKKGYQWLQQ